MNNIDYTFLIPYIKKITTDGYWYDPSKMLSRRKPVNCVMGARGMGKSTIFACMMVLCYELKGWRFGYIRRDEKETIKGARKFFSNAAKILNTYFPELKIEKIYYEAKNFYIKHTYEEKPQQFGITLPLSLAYKDKSDILEEMRTLLFDEFIAMSQKDYLGSMLSGGICDEYDRIINLMTTYDRYIGHAYGNRVCVFALGNNSSFFNPLLIGLNAINYLNTNTAREARFICPKNKLYCIELVKGEDVEATKDFQQSFVFQLSSEAEKQKMFENQTGEFDSRFVYPKPQKSEPTVTFYLDKEAYTVYYSSYKNIFWIGKGIHSKEVYNLDNESHTQTDAELAVKLNSWFYSETLVRAYCQNQLGFETIHIQRKLLLYLKLV